VDFTVDYSCLSLVESIHIRQVLAFFSKRADLDLGIDREAVAYRKFEEAELLCKETNHIFDLRAKGEFSFRPCVERVLFYAQQKITRILGDLPALQALKLKFGPGATTQVPRRNASSRRKLGETFACSGDLSGVVNYIIEEMPAWVHFPQGEDNLAVGAVVEIHRSQLHFVPKTAKTDRAIAVEPSLNQMVQLSIGNYISSRLKRFGVDISDQTLNQRLAKEGSLTGALATLDLSSASDTVSRRIVEDLLPVDWVSFLKRARTSEMEYRKTGQVFWLQKFSSMGNGFTFPLETLIFYALCEGCMRELGLKDSYNAYGDDLIVPVAAYGLLVEVLTSCGFLVNKSKSFSSGPFRESCGKDYYKGIDIRPVYVKDRLSAADVFVLHNFYVRGRQPDPALLFLDTLAPHLQKWGPEGYGDGHLIGDWKPAPCGREKGWAGYTFETFSLKGRKSFSPSPGDFVYPLYSVYIDGPVPGLADILPSRVQVSEERHGRTSYYHGAKSSSSFYSRGRLGVVTPGSSGYRLIKIYTLSPT
jgi:hypothetical protein